MARGLPVDVEIGDAYVFAALELDHQILAILHVARYLVRVDIQCDVTALSQHHDVVGDGGGRGIGGDGFTDRNNLDADSHGTVL
ncbi:hypothetical protein D3C78_1685500 [compost metagenome]